MFAKGSFKFEKYFKLENIRESSIQYIGSWIFKGADSESRGAYPFRFASFTLVVSSLAHPSSFSRRTQTSFGPERIFQELDSKIICTSKILPKKTYFLCGLPSFLSLADCPRVGHFSALCSVPSFIFSVVRAIYLPLWRHLTRSRRRRRRRQARSWRNEMTPLVTHPRNSVFGRFLLCRSFRVFAQRTSNIMKFSINLVFISVVVLRGEPARSSFQFCTSDPSRISHGPPNKGTRNSTHSALFHASYVSRMPL